MEILTLGEKIRRRRKELNMTLRELAGDRVTPGQISLVESGKSKPSIDLLEYIASKLNLSTDYIFESEKSQAEGICNYYAKLAEALIMSQNLEQAEEAVSKCAAYAKNYNVEFYKGLSEFNMGRIEYEQGKYEIAQGRFISANESFFKESKFRNIAETYIYLGMSAYKLLYFNSSLNFYRQAEKVIKEQKIVDNDLLTRIYFNISLCYSKLNNYSSTIDYALLAMEKFKERDDKFQYGQTLLMLSTAYNSKNKPKEALDYAERALQVFKEIDNLAFIAKMETNMGIILSDIGNMDESYAHLENARRIKTNINDKTLPYTLLRLADYYIKLNDYNRAMDMVKDAYEKCTDEENSEYRIAVFYYFYKLFMLKDDKKSAEQYLLNTIEYLKNLDMPKELAESYIMLGKFYKNLGEKDSALEYISKGIKLYEDIGAISLKRR